MTSRTAVPPFIVLADFDGTAAAEDVQQVILDRFADPDAWRAINREWAAGRLTTAQRAVRQWALVQASPEEILALLETLYLDAGMQSFARFCKERGYPLHIVSDGFDFYIRPMLERAGLDYLPMHANSLHFLGGRPTMTFLHQRAPDQYYGNDKTWIIESLRSPGALIVFIGDGYSDRAAAPAADLLFAKSRLADYCLEQGIPFEPFHTFRDIQRYFEALEA